MDTHQLNEKEQPQRIVDDLIGCMSVEDLKEAQQHILYALIQGKAVAKYPSWQKKKIVEYFTVLNKLFEDLGPYERKRFKKLFHKR